MTTRLIESFSDVIRKNQVESVLKMLTKEKESGKVRTVDEFVRRLDSLVRELSATTLVPTLKLFEAKVNEIIDSDSFNFMLERINDDLNAGFIETEKLDEVQKSHEAIIRDVVLKTIKSGLAELEAKISFYEFIDKNRDGFDVSLYSTFRGSANKTTRAIENSDIFFTDPRTGVALTESQEAEVDEIGECLVLPYTAKNYIKILGVKPEYTDTAFQSFRNVDRENNDIRRIIDGQKNTFWNSDRVIVKSDSNLLPSPLNIRLELDLGGLVNLNFLEIESNSEHSFILEDIEYQSDIGVVTSLGIEEVCIPDDISSTSAKVDFNRINTSKLILVFRCESFDGPYEFLIG